MQDQQDDNESNEDNFAGSDKVMIPYIKVTSMRKNEHFAIYYNDWGRLILLKIIPTFVL